MRVKCGDHWHDVSPTGLAIIIAAFQDGDLTRVKSDENDIHVSITVHAECLTGAFDPARVKDFKRRYKGNVIMVDSVRK